MKCRHQMPALFHQHRILLVSGEHVRFLGASGSFGSIALLRDVPRTATVTAITPVRVLAIERDDFLEVVTGHPRTWRRADAAIDEFDR